MKRVFFALVVFLSVVAYTPFLAAQELASITGVVTDNSGAVIPSVAVNLLDTKTNASYDTKTNSLGAYTFLKILPGKGYKMTFTKDGFDSLTVSNLYIGVGTTFTQNAQLPIGKVTQTVEVSADSQPISLNTTDASIGNTIDQHMLHELPIANRDSPVVLLALQPGVTTAGASSDDANSSRDGAVTGARTDQTNITLDGLDVNDFSTGQSFTTVGNAPVDSVQEFRDETANPLAASGRGSGAQVSMVTKSGSNNWHGALSEYHRNTITQANNIFNKLATPEIQTPKLLRNQFGANIGGPVIKDKLFFFFNYEGRRDAREDSVLATVPRDTFRNGIVNYIKDGLQSDGVTPCGEDARISTTPECIGTAPLTGPGNTVAGRDPAGVGANTALLAFINGRYPHANDLSQGDGINTAGFRFNAPVHRTANDYVARVDYNLSQKMKLFTRVSILRDISGDDANFAAPFQFPGDPVTHQIIDHSYAYVVGHTWTISSTKVNNFFYGETRSQLNFPTTFDPTGTTYYSSFGPITRPFSNPQSQNRIIPIPIYRDDFNWVHNKHNFQMGGTFKPIKTRSIQVNDFNFVTMGIGGNLTQLDPSQEPTDILQDPDVGGPDAVAASLWDTAYAFDLGRIAQLSSNFNNGPDLNPLPQGSGHRRDYRYFETEVYFQDTWRLRSDFTMTYGLRYQYYSVPYETAGLEAIPSLGLADFYNPRAAAGAAGDFSDLPNAFYNLGGKANHAPGLYKPDHKDFAPRLAFSYNPGSNKGFLGHFLGDRKTVIRAGGGVVFDHPVTNALNFIQDQSNYIFQNSTANVSPGDLGTDQRFTDLSTIPAVQIPPQATVPFLPFDGFGIGSGQPNYAVDPNLKTPYSIAYSFGFQRELPGNFQLEASYFGRLGRRLMAQSDANQFVDFLDTDSGHTLAQDFSSLTQEIRNGVANNAVTRQPFFEDQIGTGGTRFIARNFRTLVGRGDMTDVLQVLSAFGFLAPGVGLHPEFGSNVYITNKGFSNYNALLATLHKRQSHGLQFDINYAYSHSIDNVSVPANNVFGTGNLSGGLICDITNLAKCRGNSDFDVTHIISGYYIYELPFGRGKTFGSNMSGIANHILGGWQVSGTAGWRTGFAFSSVSNAFPVSFFNDAPGVFVGSSSDIKTKIHLDANGSFQLFKDPDKAINAFRGPLGTEGGTRNNLRGPGFANFDMGMAKHFNIGEKYVVEFRADAFNVFNHVNFGLPGGGNGGTADITDPGSFGFITTSANPRSMQFSLRLDF